MCTGRIAHRRWIVLGGPAHRDALDDGGTRLGEVGLVHQRGEWPQTPPGRPVPLPECATTTACRAVRSARSCRPCDAARSPGGVLSASLTPRVSVAAMSGGSSFRITWRSWPRSGLSRTTATNDPLRPSVSHRRWEIRKGCAAAQERRPAHTSPGRVRQLSGLVKRSPATWLKVLSFGPEVSTSELPVDTIARHRVRWVVQAEDRNRPQRDPVHDGTVGPSRTVADADLLELLKWHIDRYDRLRVSTAGRASVVLSAGAILSAGNALLLTQILNSTTAWLTAWWLLTFTVVALIGRRTRDGCADQGGRRARQLQKESGDAAGRRRPAAKSRVQRDGHGHPRQELRRFPDSGAAATPRGRRGGGGGGVVGGHPAAPPPVRQPAGNPSVSCVTPRSRSWPSWPR